MHIGSGKLNFEALERLALVKLRLEAQNARIQKNVLLLFHSFEHIIKKGDRKICKLGHKVNINYTRIYVRCPYLFSARTGAFVGICK